MKKWMLWAFFLSFLTVFATQNLFAEDGLEPSKLDQVLQNQERILSELADIKAELSVIKVRTSH